MRKEEEEAEKKRNISVGECAYGLIESSESENEDTYDHGFVESSESEDEEEKVEVEIDEAKEDEEEDYEKLFIELLQLAASSPRRASSRFLMMLMMMMMMVLRTRPRARKAAEPKKGKRIGSDHDYE